MMLSVTISVWTPRSFLSFKKAEHRLRNAADAEFDGGAVLHQRGDVFGNLPGRLGDFRRRHFQDRRARTAPARQCRRRE